MVLWFYYKALLESIKPLTIFTQKANRTKIASLQQKNETKRNFCAEKCCEHCLSGALRQKAAGRPTNFQHPGRSSTAASVSLEVLGSNLTMRITERILTHKRGKWMPSRGVFPAHCKGNFAVSDSVRFVCELCFLWTSVCTRCCPALCSRNRRWEVPRLGSSPQRRGPVRQSPLSASSPLPGADKLHRWQISSPSLQFHTSTRVCKVCIAEPGCVLECGGSQLKRKGETAMGSALSSRLPAIFQELLQQ